MTRTRRIPLLLAAGLLGSCGDGLEPPTTGSIALNIQVEQPPPALSRAPGDSAAAVTLSPTMPLYTSARARAEGPSNRTVDLQLVDNFWEGEITQLQPGTYTVTVEGLESGEIAATGSTSGVNVVAGQQATASVSLTSFLPNVTVGIASPTTVLEIPITLSTVQNADGYRVEWAPNPEFTGLSSRSITGTSTVLSITGLGTYYVRARAVSGTTAGAPGSPKSFQTVGDVPATGGTAGAALFMGFGTAANQRLTQLNVVPANDEDWFSLEGCTGDTLILETFAARLTPASNLNTVLRVYASDGTSLVAENNDLDGTTTDSRLQVLLLGDDRYTLQVTGTGGTVGHYELGVEAREGAKNVGAYCQVVKRVVVAPATVNLAPGATQQMTATAYDSADVAVPNVRFFWVSSNTNVAVVDTAGLVRGIGGGTATVSAVAGGEPGNSAVSVSGPPLGQPTAVVFSAQPATTTAGAAFSPAIEVEIRDANGALVTDARNTVTLAIANNPGGATLYGTKTVNANGGIARFTGLYMDKAAAGYTLSASATSLTGATSTAFTINPGAPSRLAFGQQPTNAEGNVAIAPAVTVTISDAFNNVVTSATNPVTVDFGVNVWKSVFSPGASLIGTKTVDAVSGVATFNGLRVDKPGAGYALAAIAAGLTEAASDPFAVNLTVQQVRAATMGYHTCAITSGGTYCWGQGSNGQLGDGLGTFTDDSVPRLVSGGLTFAQITGGRAHTCGLTAAGVAYCWGDNGNGQLGNNSTTRSDTPVAVSGGLTFGSLSGGGFHTCGTVGTAIYCWGYDQYGQLGDGTIGGTTLVPTLVTGGLTWASVSAGYYTTCGLTTGGSAYCWGQDINGQLGNDASLVNQAAPVVVAGGRTWASLTAAYNHTCGVDAAGAGFCWGRNIYGLLGADTTSYPRNVIQATPVPVFGGLTFSRLSAGYYHTCGLTTAGGAYCWGSNGFGQLGDGSTVPDSPLRVAVAGGLTFSAGTITVGRYHSCGRVGTAAWCWGSADQGQLGNGARVSRNQPVQIVQ
jgi:alpha-tubulin suppressor-like RCC1 family protein